MICYQKLKSEKWDHLFWFYMSTEWIKNSTITLNEWEIKFGIA